MYGTVGSALRFKTNPLRRVVCKLTQELLLLSCPRQQCFPVSSYERFSLSTTGLPEAKPRHGMMRKHGRSACCKSHMCSCHKCLGLDVSRCPRMVRDSPMTSHNREKSRNPMTPERFLHKLYEFTQMEVLDSSPACVHWVLNIYSSLDTLPLENTFQKDIQR